MKAKDIFQYALGAIVVLAFFALLYLLIMVAIPSGNETVLNIVIGALIGAFSSIIGYFYGSSKGSSDKNEMLKNGGN